MARTRVRSGEDDSPFSATVVGSTPSSSSETPVLMEGEVLAGTYEILRLIGTGGMAQVFEARDLALDRRVAVKVSKPTVVPARIRQVRAEARALARIRHPNLVTVHSVGTHRGIDYMVMELLPGVSLDEHLDQLHARNERMSLPRMLEILHVVSDALIAVHGAGMAHRDVKPSNIVIGPDDRVVLMDLGIYSPRVSMATEPLVVGTPEYMAPEVISQSIRPSQGHLVDIYALGVVAFEMLAGVPPFWGCVAEVMIQHLNTQPPSLATYRPDAPAKIEQLIAECLAKHPGDRPPSAEAVAWRLAEMRQRPRAAALTAHEPFPVLIVDDDPDSIEVVTACVEARVAGAEILVASNAAAAIKWVRARHPRLLLLDMRLPDMNGLEVAMYLKGSRLNEGMTVVAVSGSADANDVKVLRELGVSRFVRKGPSMIGQLSYLLHQVLAETHRS